MKCNKCKKKIMFEYECKCKLSFCINCISCFVHGCTFDYKEEKRKQLADNNVKVLPPKVTFI